MTLKDTIDEELDINTLSAQFQQLKNNQAEVDKFLLQNPAVSKSIDPLRQKINQSTLGFEKNLGVIIQQENMKKQMAAKIKADQEKQANQAKQTLAATTAGTEQSSNTANGTYSTKTATANQNT